ncbi:MAG: polyprenyl synthetase family protein [Candidatus Omnitrophica bacterium]|nr:polyprenyl synthetase family protein [Candidatus Omnitrophota bacterium]
MDDISKILKARKIVVDKALNEILPKQVAAPKKLHKAMRYSVFSGGKRIRPILAIESCFCCGGKIRDVLRAACAIELVHTFSLIHDDLPSMDDDDYRRGKWTCHKKFDEATAILAGDGLLSLAFETLTTGGDSGIKVKLIRELTASTGSMGMIGGQCVDIEYDGRKKLPSILNYINLRKTGALIKAALKIGAIAAGADSKKIKTMGEFGKSIGGAFQIIDDILDNGDSVRGFGKEGAYKKARFLTEKAKDSLSIFSGKAGNLRAIADYLVERKI